MGAGVVKPDASKQNPSSSTAPQQQQSSKRNNSSTVCKSAMPCAGCSADFKLFMRKRMCIECAKNHCSQCLTKETLGNTTRLRCSRCRLLLSGKFTRKDLIEYKAKDLRQFLNKKHISTDSCMEKDDLVDLLLRVSNNSQFLREQAEHERHLEVLQRRRLVDEEFSQNPSLRPVPSSSSLPPEAPPPNAQAPPPPTQAPPTDSQAPPPTTGTSNPGPSTADAGSSERQQPGADDGEEGEEEEVTNVPGSSDTTPQLPRASSKARGYASLDRITGEEDMEEMTVRQLKEILALNYVDYKGCCEKWELLERVKRLWGEHCKNKDRAEEFESAENAGSAGESEVCKICMDAVIDCVLLECGHMVTCTTCGRQMNECPICRQYVVRVVHIFKA